VEAKGLAAPQVDGRLAVREEASAFLVVREEDPEDWLARFEKADGFPAREWAENMVRVYNRRVDLRISEAISGAASPLGPHLSGYHPDPG
jgi:hypothetical protein